MAGADPSSPAGIAPRGIMMVRFGDSRGGPVRRRGQAGTSARAGREERAGAKGGDQMPTLERIEHYRREGCVVAERLLDADALAELRRVTDEAAAASAAVADRPRRRS